MLGVLFLLLLVTLNRSQETDYIEYLVGDPSTQIVLAAPHAGYLRPDSIPDRPPAGCWDEVEQRCVWEHLCGEIDTTHCGAVSGRDGWTFEQSYILRDELEEVTGSRPHLVVNHLHRSKMDANRYIDQSAFGIPEAEAAWRDFQNAINASKASVTQNRGMGLFIDLHGHGHPEDWVELGYTISADDLDEGSINPNASSIRSVANRVSGTTTFESVLRGATSFGRCLEGFGYGTVPSVRNPGPGGGNYFSGGYNTETHGSRYEGTVDGIQIESPPSLRNDIMGPDYTADIAICLRNFLLQHYPAN